MPRSLLIKLRIEVRVKSSREINCSRESGGRIAKFFSRLLIITSCLLKLIYCAGKGAARAVAVWIINCASIWNIFFHGFEREWLSLDEYTFLADHAGCSPEKLLFCIFYSFLRRESSLFGVYRSTGPRVSFCILQRAIASSSNCTLSSMCRWRVEFPPILREKFSARTYRCTKCRKYPGGPLRTLSIGAVNIHL